ncbi:hypothetical protein [Pontibacter harenae]|uniref:hypothetical protein n=1 Tax=Pontibacter harenae TaxID=2894083 RepID=UPI001E639A66|nr:hypothetical protein [Pontibacter harenae]MCC9168567.1 hypothetical protein [Pontibacter harenae]
MLLVIVQTLSFELIKVALAVKRISIEMVIADKYEVYALHKLLSKVKFSEHIDSYDLNEFAGSSLITSLLLKAREEVANTLKDEGYADLLEDWLMKSVFKFDSATGKAIANRLKHLSDSTLTTIASWSREQVREYAINLVKPLEYEQEEIEKLMDYIVLLAKGN